MQDIRKVLCWLFAVNCLLHLLIPLRSILYVIHRHYALLALRNLLFDASFSVVAAVICGWAWWAIWKGKPSARAWGISASVMYLLIFLLQFAVPERPFWDHHVGALTVGIVGLVAFLRHYEQPYPS